MEISRITQGAIITYDVAKKFSSKIQVQAITNDIINIFAGDIDGERNSSAIEGDKLTDVNVSVVDNSDYVELATKNIKVNIYPDGKTDFFDKDDKPISTEYNGERTPLEVMSNEEVDLMIQEGHAADIAHDTNYKIQSVRNLDKSDCIYGLGDKTGVLNKRQYSYEMWNTDDPAPHEDNFPALYKSIPFFIVLKEDDVYGIFFDNHNKTYFDMGKENDSYYLFGSDAGNLDYYFIHGSNIPDIISKYTYLTGTTPLPQMWTLGYHQSRWSYRSEEEVRDIAENMETHDIPCDAIHLDIDYMDHFKVFTWDEKRFPNQEKLTSDLKKKGIKTVTIIDPGVKVEDGYKIYEEGVANNYFAKTPDGDNYINKVWPGDAMYPDFGSSKVRKWWGENHKFLIEKGSDGIWTDMNEPASFVGPLPDDVVFSDNDKRSDHKSVHNIYGHNMVKATYEGIKMLTGKRPFVITRACYAGTQKYSTAWTGDNHSIWSHLKMSIPQLCNLGMSGLGFIGTDICGFGSDATSELFARWVEIGCFSPLFRNHSALGTRRQEPWAFGQEILDINKKYIRLRYSLIPYYYDAMKECEEKGYPVFRPLVFHYEHDENVKNMNDQFMVGNNIIVSPVINQGDRKKLVYLPAGIWYDFWTNERIEGGKHFIKDAPLDVCPMYVKEGTILPTYPVKNHIDPENEETLILKVYPGDGCYVHYQDNGIDFAYQMGEYNQYIFRSHNGDVSTEILHDGYKKYKKIEIEKII